MEKDRATDRGRAFTSAEQQALLELINGCNEPGQLYLSGSRDRDQFTIARPRLNGIGQIQVFGTAEEMK